MSGNNRATAARRNHQNHPSRPVPEHYSAHYAQPAADKVPPLHKLSHFTISCDSVSTSPPVKTKSAFSWSWKVTERFLVVTKSVQKALINAVITVTVGNSKGKKKGSCTYSWPVSVPCLWTSWCRCLGVGYFGGKKFSYFCPPFFKKFFSLLLFTDFLNPNALSLQHCQCTFAHAHTATFAGRKVPAKVWCDFCVEPPRIRYPPDLDGVPGGRTGPGLLPEGGGDMTGPSTQSNSLFAPH